MLRRRGRRPDEAEDLVQEAFVRLLTYIDKGEQVLEPEAFVARAALNLSVDRSRRERVHLYERRAVEEFALPALTPNPEEQAGSHQCLQQVQTILDEKLGERARRVFFLHCFEGLTYDEIAKQINMSRRTVEKDLAKAINVLSVSSLPPP
ncbi:MAG: sigma-70 family RNA polymerase sigma factor [Steroidobacter sp.]|nr:sigma-70 family RNA polymerase sigma factor [Steroidobacter sp.]